MTIRTKLLLTLLAVTILPTGVFSWLSYNSSEESLKREIAGSSQEAARLALQRTIDFFHLEMRYLRAYSREARFDGLIHEGFGGEVTRLLTQQARIQDAYLYINALDSSGRVVASSRADWVGRDLSLLPILETSFSGEVLISDPHFDPLAGQHTVIMSLPITDKGDLLMVAIDWYEVVRMITSLEIGGEPQNLGTHLMLMDASGLVIACIDPTAMFVTNLVAEGLESASLAIGGQEGSILETSEHGLPSFSSFTFPPEAVDLPVPLWSMVLQQDPQKVLAPIEVLRTSAILNGSLVALLLVFVSFFFSAMISKQISRFANAATQIGGGDLTQRLAVRSADEFTPLTRAFNQMAADLETSRNELQNQTNKLESIMEVMQDGLTIQDGDFNIIYQNQRLVELFPDSLGQKCYCAYESNEQICDGCPVELAFADGKPHSAIRHVTLPDGRPTIWENVACPIRDASGAIVSCLEIARNVTEKYQVEQQLRKAQKMEAVGQLAGGIAHDFNNILTAIGGYTQMAIEDLPAEHKSKGYLDQVRLAADRAKEMTSRILTYSRQHDQERQATELHDVCDEVMDLLQPTLPATIEIRRSIARDAGMVLADTSQIHQVAMNLCTNAYQAMAQEGGVLSVDLRQVVVDEWLVSRHPELRTGTFVRIQVMDTGPGIPKDVAERILDPFFTTKGAGEGTGLGLSVADGIIAAHDGVMVIESEPGQGACFSVYLPVIAGGSEKAEDEQVAVVDMPSLSILLVDDEQAIVDLTSQVLQRIGHRVTAVTDSREALDLFQRDPDAFDLVLTDLTMPKLTGLELTLRIRETRAEVPVILTTGFADAVATEKVRQVGIFEVVRKPYTSLDLHHAIWRVSESRRSAPSSTKMRGL